MKRISTRKTTPISTLVVMSMMVASLTGCSGGKDTPKETIEVEAADVAFNKDGRYTTTISAKDDVEAKSELRILDLSSNQAKT